MKPGWMAWAGLSLLAAACQGPTELVVVVDSDLEPGVEIAAVQVTASTGGGASESHRFALDETPLPFSFGLRPTGRDGETVHVAVRALAPDGAAVISQTLTTRFVPGETRRLDVPLARACLAMECDDGARCVAGACQPREVDASALPSGGADDPAPLLDGPRVAPDAGPGEEGTCEAGAACDVGDPCRPGQIVCGADGPTCEAGEPLPAGTPCGEGRTCDGEGRCGVRTE